MKFTAQQLMERAESLEAKAQELRRRARELAKAEQERRVEEARRGAAYFLELGYTHANLTGEEVSLAEIAERGITK